MREAELESKPSGAVGLQRDWKWVNEQEAIDFLRDLVLINAVNPLGKEKAPA